jgi:CubicO group peptidase (beta-lactamase class C family)
MKKISIIIIVSLFFSSIFFLNACKKDETPSVPTKVEIIKANIKTVLDSVIENTHMPWLVTGVWVPNEDIDFVYAAGVSNIETKTPKDDDMVFRIGTNTKTLTIKY